LRTVRMVVPCQTSGEEEGALILQCDIGPAAPFVKRRPQKEQFGHFWPLAGSSPALIDGGHHGFQGRQRDLRDTPA